MLKHSGSIKFKPTVEMGRKMTYITAEIAIVCIAFIPALFIFGGATMNRAERRRKHKANSEVTHMYKDSDIERIKQEQTSKAVDVAFTLLLGISIMVLNDKYGFSREQLQAVTDDVFDLYASYERGYLTLEDIHSTLQEEVGINIIEELKDK